MSYTLGFTQVTLIELKSACSCLRTKTKTWKATNKIGNHLETLWVVRLNMCAESDVSCYLEDPC